MEYVYPIMMLVLAFSLGTYTYGARGGAILLSLVGLLYLLMQLFVLAFGPVGKMYFAVVLLTSLFIFSLALKKKASKRN